MLGGFKVFSDTTGLHINFNKSEVYCAGMSSQETARITEMSGFRISSLPFRYLGVPMSSKKLKAADCDALIDKMCSRIRVWCSRHLSYAGRLQLVNSVLMSIRFVSFLSA